MTKTEQAAIELCALRCDALTDPANSMCGVEAVHKEAVKLYVRTWIMPILTQVALPPDKRNGYWLKHVHKHLREHRQPK